MWYCSNTESVRYYSCTELKFMCEMIFYTDWHVRVTRVEDGCMKLFSEVLIKTTLRWGKPLRREI